MKSTAFYQLQALLHTGKFIDMIVGFDILTPMKVAAFIPARYASTRLNGKPIASICGKPMVRWVYEAAKKASLVNDVTVATDDERIFDAVRAFGGNVVMTSMDTSQGPTG